MKDVFKRVEGFVQSNKVLISVLIIASAILITLLFIFDVGISSSYHVKKSFNYAFTKRMVGDCDAFLTKVVSDRLDWNKKCVEERDSSGSLPITKFSIEGISINKNRAYLKVELFRDDYNYRRKLASSGHKYPEEGRVINYVMKKVNGKWYLDQDTKLLGRVGRKELNNE